MRIFFRFIFPEVGFYSLQVSCVPEMNREGKKKLFFIKSYSLWLSSEVNEHCRSAVTVCKIVHIFSFFSHDNG